MTIERMHTGAWRISDMRGDYLVTRVYFYYTKREAVALFNQESHHAPTTK